jgi:hypothetical protein
MVDFDPCTRSGDKAQRETTSNTGIKKRTHVARYSAGKPWLLRKRLGSPSSSNELGQNRDNQICQVVCQSLQCVGCTISFSLVPALIHPSRTRRHGKTRACVPSCSMTASSRSRSNGAAATDFHSLLSLSESISLLTSELCRPRLDLRQNANGCGRIISQLGAGRRWPGNAVRCAALQC